MAITIEVRKAQFIKKAAESLFVSFPYSMDTVAKIKSLPVRFYVGASREWEVPVADMARVVDLFPQTELTLKCQAVTVVKESEVAKPAVTFANEASKSFEYKTTPFQHQIESMVYAVAHNKFLLGDEQGLGKTKQAIDIAVSRKQTGKFKHCLIVCGVNSVKFNWYREIMMHSNEGARILGCEVKYGVLKEGSVKNRIADLNADLKEFFLITNIETLRDKEVQDRLRKLTEDGTIGMVVVDEMHKCKNAQSQQGKAVHELKSYYKLALTGTPLMNKPIDLYNIMKWLDAERGSFYSFRAKYCVMGGYGGKQIVGYRNLDELRDRFEKIMLRRKKDEVLNLPPKIRSTEYVLMTAKQKQLYNEIKNEIKANLDEIELSPNPLAQLIRLRQATAHTSILSNKIAESAKLDRLEEIIEELAESGQKAIIFSNWTDVTDLVTPKLAQYNPAVITGKTKNRDAEVQKFQHDDSCKVIVGTIGAMGTGLTLTAASTVIFMDKPWTMANTEQAEDRAHRIGTKGTVNIITLVCKDTIDERIEEIIYEKAEMAQGLIEGDMDVLSKLDMSARDMVDRLLS